MAEITGYTKTGADNAFAKKDLSDIVTQDALKSQFASRDIAELIQGRFPMASERKLIGPIASGVDAPTVTVNAAADPSFNKSYNVQTAATWPVDMGPGPSLIVSGMSHSNPGANFRLIRFMMDSDRVAIRTEVVGDIQSGCMMFVNGAPVSLDPVLLTTGISLTTLVFPEARPRMVEILMNCGLSHVYTSNPYRCWLPPEGVGQKVLLIGDSYSAGVTMETGTTEHPRIYGFAATMGLHLGVDNTYWTDGIGGTGYLKDAAGGDDYVTRLPTHYASQPDVIIVGGGGANDLFASQYSVVEVISAGVNLFQDARENVPGAKLVFMEGFAPPGGYSTFNDEYTAIRQGLQNSLTDVGVYYIDIATTSAWLDGLGYIGAETGVGNSDIYIGGDGVHPSMAGGSYIRERLAPKLRTVLADNGDLVNQLI